MESFVTGGKTWVLPDPEPDVPPVIVPIPAPHALLTRPPTPKAPPVPDKDDWGFTKTFLFGTSFLYFAYLVAVLIALMGIIAVSTFSDNTPIIHANGGITVPPVDDLTLTPKIIALAIIPPVVFAFIMTLLDDKTKLFDEGTGDKNFFAGLGIIGITLIICAWIICNELGFAVSDSSTLENIKSWMDTRYGFEPYRVSELGDLLNGEHLYSADPNFPVHDVYFKEVDGAYLLFDANGNELPVKH